MIKANFPSRIAFRVAQKVDSRTILDEQGAEVLLGKGDKLVKLNGSTDTLRVQCPFVSEEEVSALCDHLRSQGEPKYDEQILEPAEESELEDVEEKVDARFEEALLIVRDSQRCSTSWLQRKMTIGYNRAAKMVDMMERRGYVGPQNGSKDREVLITP
jgi:S-DNA-T family DNA segregation ATPase FtsK/SpoIIIE